MWPFAVLFLFLAFSTRLGLALFTGTSVVPLAIWPAVFARGLIADLAVLSWLLIPFLLWRMLQPASPRWLGVAPWLRLLAFWLGSFILLFLALAEATFWLEFSARFNFIAVDYLIYTHEVLGNIRESYPVGFLLAGIALASTLLVFLQRRRLTRPAPTPTPLARLAAFLAAILLPLLSWHFVEPDMFAFSSNAYANELAANGLYTFFSALRHNDLPYDRFYATLPSEHAEDILRRLGVRQSVESQPRSANVDEHAYANHPFFLRRPKNVVLITVESLSASFLGAFGNHDGLTPRLDALAKEGLLFTRLYASGTRTVRGLEAVTLGTPPIPGQAIVRRPHNDHLATIGEILRRHGYATFFFYGGYGYFDNMNAFFGGNDYEVVDRTQLPADKVGFANIWGVADEFLFDHVLARLDAAHGEGKPFFAQVMTTSNHRPYTYPDGRIDIPSPGGRAGAVKYTDYAIGRFIDQARAKPWFGDTLFVIVADHCASAAGKTTLSVAGYHIPMIFYAPGLVSAGRYDRLASQIDVPPTLLDLLGVPGKELFFGASLLAPSAPERAFLANYQALGYLKEGRLTILLPKHRAESYRIDERGAATPAPIDRRLLEEAIAYYQSAYFAFQKGKLRLR
ncbi:MAG: sulfatase-like hydrolase/transferase [Rhodocyclaceae bacterium]|nr:sulfatase-like hydrolase/transferase [Rhodocyclaceae bacterium]